MSEEKITGLEFLKDIPKTNGLVSAYGSVNLEQLNNVIKRLKKIPNYDEILKDNNKLQQENNQLKSILTELEDELNIAFKELQPGELVIGQNILKNIQITIQELKEKYK